MRFMQIFVLILLFCICPTAVHAQTMQQREEAFLDTPPRIGDPLPDVTVYSSDGTPFKTSDLRGHYTVLTFGCLTCPPSLWNIAGLEAVQRDYGPKDVKFFFIYKSLAHPELAGHYVQPFTIDERLLHAQQAKKQLDTEIPWIVDAMDNRLKHALGDRPNSQFLVDPEGIVVRKRAWSNPGLVRRDLQGSVGPVENITTEEDLHLDLGVPPKAPAARGVVPRVSRPQMWPLAMEPTIDPKSPLFYAKLRAEADAELLRNGKGLLYVGFHLDPFHQAHWNNLTAPLSFTIEAAETVAVERRKATAATVAATTDADPREFMLKVASWPVDEPLKIVVTYFACVGEESCHAVRQEYLLHRTRDGDGGGARGEGAGYWTSEELSARLLSGDKDGDRKLRRTEAVGLILPHFEKLDSNQDGSLDVLELNAVTDWVNHHHRPGTPPVASGTDGLQRGDLPTGR